MSAMEAIRVSVSGGISITLFIAVFMMSLSALHTSTFLFVLMSRCLGTLHFCFVRAGPGRDSDQPLR